LLCRLYVAVADLAFCEVADDQFANDEFAHCATGDNGDGQRPIQRYRSALSNAKEIDDANERTLRVASYGIDPKQSGLDATTLGILAALQRYRNGTTVNEVDPTTETGNRTIGRGEGAANGPEGNGAEPRGTNDSIENVDFANRHNKVKANVPEGEAAPERPLPTQSAPAETTGLGNDRNNFDTAVQNLNQAEGGTLTGTVDAVDGAAQAAPQVVGEGQAALIKDFVPPPGGARAHK
jgi:hypothetical protein